MDPILKYYRLDELMLQAEALWTLALDVVEVDDCAPRAARGAPHTTRDRVAPGEWRARRLINGIFPQCVDSGERRVEPITSR
jgi:hypothetical protein